MFLGSFNCRFSRKPLAESLCTDDVPHSSAHCFLECPCFSVQIQNLSTSMAALVTMTLHNCCWSGGSPLIKKIAPPSKDCRGAPRNPKPWRELPGSLSHPPNGSSLSQSLGQGQTFGFPLSPKVLLIFPGGGDSMAFRRRTVDDIRPALPITRNIP